MKDKVRRVPAAMTIAGSDSGGGAGIQADLKTFAAFEVYGTSAITAITAQNTLGVTAVQEIALDVIAAQIDAILADIGADAAKTGMLSSAGIIRTVVDRVHYHRIEKLVVDPVMIAKSGDRLLREDAVNALRDLLLPVALVVTPNIPEAEVLTGREIRTDQDVEDAARAIHDLGARYVVVKGGHREDEADAVDVLFDGQGFESHRSARLASENTHGTGCTFSAAIAANLAKGASVHQSVAAAKAYLSGALAAGYTVGGGKSPVHHLYRQWSGPAESLRAG